MTNVGPALSCPSNPSSLHSSNAQLSNIPWVRLGRLITSVYHCLDSIDYHSGVPNPERLCSAGRHCGWSINGAALRGELPSTRCTACPSTAEEAPIALADSQSHPSIPLLRFTGESQVAFSRSIHIRCRYSANARRVSTILSLDVCDRGSTGLGEARYANNGAVVDGHNAAVIHFADRRRSKRPEDLNERHDGSFVLRSMLWVKLRY